MKTYKAPDNSLHSLSANDIANGGEKYLPDGCVEVSEAEAEALRPKPPEPTYADLRRAEYPPLGDQLDALWKGGADAAAMKAIIDGVKAKYPKP